MKILQDNNEIIVIDFGTVEIGQSKELALEVKNDSNGRLIDLTFTAPGIEIVEQPEVIEANGVGALLLKWIPTLKLKPFQIELEISGKELY